jgi:hypothetical protein
MTRKIRIRVTTRIGLLLVLAAGAGILAYAGPGSHTGWTIAAGFLAVTAICVLIAWIGDERTTR